MPDRKDPTAAKTHRLPVPSASPHRGSPPEPRDRRPVPDGPARYVRTLGPACCPLRSEPPAELDLTGWVFGRVLSSCRDTGVDVGMVIVLGGNEQLQHGDKPDSGVQLGRGRAAVEAPPPQAMENGLLICHGNARRSACSRWTAHRTPR